VLEEGKVVRVGSMQPIPVPARVVAATHRDLEQDVAAGRFRQDLLFRLAVHVLRVPALRERLSDLPELVDVIITTTCARFGIRQKPIAPEALELLAAYDWQRNNVRELRNVVERMLIAADGDRIGAEHVPAEIIEGSPRSASETEARTFVERKAEAERQIIVAALERNEWHITRTAQQLGLADHASLLKIMRRHGISSR
jgi:DNA-binding NtrC family response regulator